MAQFPKAEADVVALANAMVAGYTAHAADFPSADALGLTTALTDYNTTKLAQIDADAAAQVATEAKNLKIDALEDVMRDELKKSEVDVGSDSEKLEYIGWGPKALPTPADPPGQPRNLDPVSQGAGMLFFRLEGACTRLWWAGADLPYREARSSLRAVVSSARGHRSPLQSRVKPR